MSGDGSSPYERPRQVEHNMRWSAKGSMLRRALPRLRISLSAAHTTEDVEALVAALRRCGLPHPAPPPGLQASPAVEELTQQQPKPALADAARGVASPTLAAAECSAASPQSRL